MVVILVCWILACHPNLISSEYYVVFTRNLISVGESKASALGWQTFAGLKFISKPFKVIESSLTGN